MMQSSVDGLVAIVLALVFGVASAPAFSARAGQAGRGAENRAAMSIAKRSLELIDEGNLAAARKELERGLVAFPHEAALYNYLGVVNAEANHPRSAEKDFRRAIRESPGYAGAYLNLGRLYQSESKTWTDGASQALAIYEKLLIFDAANAEANYQAAVIEMRQGHHRESISHLRRLSASDQEKPQALAILCVDLAETGEVREASAAATRLVKAVGLTETDVLSVLPELEAHRALAIQLLGGLEARRLASPKTLQRLGALFEQDGKLTEARAAFEQAAGAEPNAAGPLIDLARVANRQHDYRGALGYLAHARAIEPENAAIHFFFGMVCVEMNLHEEAYRELSKAVELKPDDPYYNYALGAVSSQRSDPRESIPYFKKFCVLRPSDPRGKLALGAAYYYSHNLQAAQAELLEVANNAITRAGANYFLGRIANDQGKWPDAVGYLKAAIRDDPGYADAYATLGSVELNQHDYNQAGATLRRALAIDPSNYLANLKLMVLYQRTKDPRSSAQAHRFQSVTQQREERAKLFLRTIRVVP